MTDQELSDAITRLRGTPAAAAAERPDYLETARWVDVSNPGGERIPGGSAVEAYGREEDRLLVRKPTEANASGVMFTHPLTDIEPYGAGQATDSPLATAHAAAGAARRALGTASGSFALAAGTGFVSLTEVGPDGRCEVLRAAGGGGGDGGFYAALTGGSASPYSFAEVVGPAAASAAVAGGRTGTAHERYSGLAGIPTGAAGAAAVAASDGPPPVAAVPAATIVWVYAGPAEQPWRFNCRKLSMVTGWRINAGPPCTITPVVGGVVDYYYSAASLCGGGP